VSRRAGQSRGCLAGLFSGFFTVVGLVVIAAVIATFVYNSPGPPAKAGGETVVVLRRGAGLTEIAAALETAQVVPSAPMFIAAAQLTGGGRRLKAGEYAFASRASLKSVLSKLRAGDIVHHRITIPEGLTSQQAVDILNASKILVGQVPTPPEGSILPETYDVTRGQERASVLKRMMDDRDALLDQLWAKRKPNPLIRTKEEAVTLASIVEKETSKAAERPRVAAVYLNRLKTGMRLQSDPTVIYGVSRGMPLGRGLRQSELDNVTPYNTYQVAGLPPTPIANPGRASLAAVLDPPDTDELYFVADGTGGHVFATTYEQHEANVARWRAIERGGQRAQPETLPQLTPPPAVPKAANPVKR
jgi:UPF0755 protein